MPALQQLRKQAFYSLCPLWTPVLSKRKLGCQLYLWKDREASKDLLERAQKGSIPLLVAVETPVAGQRLRDTRNGMTIPPQLTAKIVLAASYRPA